ncbi:endonuclease MutS2 [Granulicella arctica]|uniref:Endonuclease MutS2 n=1 Tax=Granulicella arctica TaxID=940613 RepID=A0A7Y9PEU3_9BACT|nr:DNA mismatch repair protein MutS2 [Granulicella arctica]
MPHPTLLPVIPAPLAESSAVALEWPRLRDHIAAKTNSPLGFAWIQNLKPTSDRPWLDQQHQRTAELRAFLTAGGSFTFHGLFDPTLLLDKARIEGAALEPLEILSLLTVAERVAAWRTLLDPAPNATRYHWPSIEALSTDLLDPIVSAPLAPLLHRLRGKIEPDGTLSDDASPELRRIRRALERQHRAIEESLRRAARHLREEGNTQSNSEDLITIRGDRFVIPVKAEFKRRVPGVIHASSSSGQTVFIEPLETIEQNNELVRLLDEEQSEIHRILVAMTHALGESAPTLHLGCAILAEVESHAARARFAQDLNCTRPVFTFAAPKKTFAEPKNTVILSEARSAESKDPCISPEAPQTPQGSHSHPTKKTVLSSDLQQNCHPERSAQHAAEGPAVALAVARPHPNQPQLSLTAARHPLLELRMRAESGPSASPTPLTITLPPHTKQLIISGPNTGGKTVSLKTLGLLSIMAQSGVPIPAEEAHLPLFDAIYADIGDAQSIERNLSSFSAHVVNVDRISRVADVQSLVLLDELGSATDPEEGAALAVAVAAHFLALDSWTAITTHLTSLKVYAASRTGVLNAAVGFDQQTLSPTYELRLGVPGASAGLNIAERLGMSPDIIQNARAQMTTQTADIGAFLDQLHDQLTAAAAEREALQQKERELSRERSRLEIEGRLEQKARTKELEAKLHALIADVESQLRETVKAIDDKTLSQKIARDSAARMTRAKREFSEQFSSTVLAHNTRADQHDTPLKPKSPTPIKVGDLVQLKSLGRQARVNRILDDKTFEVSAGPMKMRIDRSDIAAVEQVKAITPLEAARRRGGVTIQTAATTDADYMTSEINVIGRTSDEAATEVERFLDRAFLSGLPRIRIVHGTGMGILRRTLRELLRNHPHVATITEPPPNQGGQGATEVELRQ